MASDKDTGCLDSVFYIAVLCYICWTLMNIEHRLFSIHWELEKIARRP